MKDWREGLEEGGEGGEREGEESWREKRKTNLLIDNMDIFFSLEKNRIRLVFAEEKRKEKG